MSPKQSHTRLATVLGLLAVLLLPCLAAADAAETDAAKAFDWPQFRGAGGDGHVPAAGFGTDWPKDGLAVAWKIPLGNGFSAISAVDGVLYTQYSADGNEYLVALDAASGEERWKLRTDEERKDQFGDGPRATPTVDGDLVFAVSALGKLYAADRASGEVRWKKDLRQAYGASVPTWGISAQPAVVDDLLLYNVGGKSGHLIVAWKKASGELAWHSGSGNGGYSMPLTFTVGGVRQTVFFTAKKVVAVDPSNGEELWTLPWSTAYDVNAAAPVFIAPDRLFVSSGYDTGASLFEIVVEDDSSGGRSVEPRTLWQSRGMKNQFSSSIYHDGHLYGFDNRVFKAIDADTGEDLWRKKGFGHGSLFFVAGHLVVLGDNGKLALVEASPEAYLEKASFQVADGKHWTVPTYYDGRLYVRNEKEMIAYEVP